MGKKFGWGFMIMWLFMVGLQLVVYAGFIWAIVHFVRKFW